MRQKKIYIAGKYRDVTPEKVAENVKMAEAVAAELLSLGYIVICPHSMTHGWERFEKLTDDDFLRNGLALLGVCDELVLVGDWSDSQGTKDEVIEAVRCGKPVHKNYADFLEAEEVYKGKQGD